MNDLITDDYFKKRFLGQPDFSEEPQRFEITGIEEMNVARDDQPPDIKPVMFISGHDRPLPFNKTNLDTCRIELGKHMKEWVGHRVAIWTDPTVMYKGERKGGVRLRVVSEPTKKPAAATSSIRARVEAKQDRGDPVHGLTQMKDDLPGAWEEGRE